MLPPPPPHPRTPHPTPWDKLLTSSLSCHLSPSPIERSGGATTYIHGNKGPFRQQPGAADDEGRDGGREEEEKRRQIIPAFMPLSASRSSLFHLFTPPPPTPIPYTFMLLLLPRSDLFQPLRPSPVAGDGSRVGNHINVPPAPPLVSTEGNHTVRVTVWALAPCSNPIRPLEPQPERQHNLIIST